ncbi:hypothetical protein Daci_3232 [Delftia acidovorans SPH-1]|uniref:Uncharacterized protein n=1 Tax=Delftia acidovorans (strain DSM 14801 / SPH-1) TaxID=398578 RepID=A9BW54_DELAS|nr:hypothetical protein [Delftia acidovorans]ABX35870.1 hypothetical protein Daci_3232 [Delftia acidovorans SPH-1]QPS74844.1 hypothetical protein I6G48_30290 [Delftia acidovorans]
MSAAREVWQSYDCPVQLTDMDLFDEEMVFKGQAFRCSWCGGNHVAGFGVKVETFVRVGEDTTYPDLPETAEALQRLKDGA